MSQRKKAYLPYSQNIPKKDTFSFTLFFNFRKFKTSYIVFLQPFRTSSVIAHWDLIERHLRGTMLLYFMEDAKSIIIFKDGHQIDAYSANKSWHRLHKREIIKCWSEKTFTIAKIKTKRNIDEWKPKKKKKRMEFNEKILKNYPVQDLPDVDCKVI